MTTTEKPIRIEMTPQFHRWAYGVVREEGIPWVRVGPVAPEPDWYILFPNMEAYESAAVAWKKEFEKRPASFVTTGDAYDNN